MFLKQGDLVMEDDVLVVKDAHGAVLADGDTVAVIKDLKVKGSSEVLKQGTKFKNIRLTDDPREIESGKMVLKTEFIKKVS
jgi:protein PhnA